MLILFPSNHSLKAKEAVFGKFLVISILLSRKTSLTPKRPLKIFNSIPLEVVIKESSTEILCKIGRKVPMSELFFDNVASVQSEGSRQRFQCDFYTNFQKTFL